MKNSIAIVTVTYNSSENIEKMLISVIKNKDLIECVYIIENNSPDKLLTKSICNKYKNKIRLKYILSENRGFGTSCNYGAGMTNAKYILFLNPDTELQKHSLKLAVEHLEANGADICGGKAINYEGKVHGSVVRFPSLYIGLFEFTNLGKLFNFKQAHKWFYYEDMQISTVNNDMHVEAVSGSNLLIRNSSYKLLKGFDENIFMYLEDVDLCKRAKDLGMKTVYCPHSVIWHIGGASSKNRYKIRHQAWFDARRYYFKKHFGYLINALIQPLFVIEEYILKSIRSL